MNLTEILVKAQIFLADKLLPAALIFLLGYFLQRLLIRFIDLTVERTVSSQKLTRAIIESRVRTIGYVLKNASGIAIILIALSTALAKLSIDIRPLLAGAGIAGLAIGFGAQTLVRDVVTGFFILSENQYNVGDSVQIAGIKGLVREIKLRTTTVQTEDGSLCIIPHSQVTIVTRFSQSK